jgi:hypothetical protein
LFVTAGNKEAAPIIAILHKSAKKLLGGRHRACRQAGPRLFREKYSGIRSPRKK